MTGPCVSTSWPEYWCCAVGYNCQGLCCVKSQQTSQDGKDGYVSDGL
jgi:hypothetical protein